MTALYLHEDVKELLSGKTLVVLGDSVERSVYKDLVCLLQENRYLSEQELRKKGEESFIGDELVYGGCKGEQKNSVDYRECRYFKNDDACCRYYFITICYGPYIEEVLQELSQEPTDIIVMNSCLWDVHRHGKAGVEKYEENLEKLVSALQRLIPDCLFIWVTTPPVHIKSKGGFLMQPGTDLVKINEVRYCNEIAREVFREANEIDSRFRIVDLDYVFRHFEHHRASDGVHWNARAHRRMSNMILEEVSKAFSKEVPRVLGGWDVQPYSIPYESWENRLAKNWGSTPFEYDISHPSNWDFMSGLDFPPGTHMNPPEGFPPFHNPHSVPPFGTPPFIDDPSGLLRNLPFYDLDDLGHARQQVEYQSESRKRKRQEDSETDVVPEKQYRFGFTNSHIPVKGKTNQNGEQSPKFSIIEVDGKMKKLVQIDDDTVIHVMFTDKEKEEYLKDQAKKLEQERIAKEKKEQEVAWLKEQDQKEIDSVSGIDNECFQNQTKKIKMDFNEEVSAKISALANFFLERYFKSSVETNIFNIVPPLTVLAAQVLLKLHFCKSNQSIANHTLQNHNQRELNCNGSHNSVTSVSNYSTPQQRDIPKTKVDTKALLAMPSPFAKSRVNSNSIERKYVELSNEPACKYSFDEPKVLKESEVFVKNEELKETEVLARNEFLKESYALPETKTYLNVKTEHFIPENENNSVESLVTNFVENLSPKKEIENLPECPANNVLSTPNKVDTFITASDSSETCSKLSETTSLTVSNVVSSTLDSEVDCSEIDTSRPKKKKDRNPNETKEERRLRKKLRRERREERKRLKESNELSQSQVPPVVQTEAMWDLSSSENLISRQRSSTWGPNYMSLFSQSTSLPYNQTVNNQAIYYQQTIQHGSRQHGTIDQHEIYKQQLEQQQQRLAIAQRQAQQQALLLQQRQQQEAAYQKALGNNIVQPTVPQPQLYIDEYGQTYTLEEETFIMGPSGQIQSLNSSYIQQQMQGAQSPLINPSLLYLQQSSKFL
ncbi:uncharacterized protein LOC100211039 isoform X1 [Hydra vulgaris]|uniref:Uncharacterized protein LOC100211039 isoform X1 n=1 Tax=Hydra vulgaris TaxID=6087 RepID=A0ABM4BKB1_HYDVU